LHCEKLLLRKLTTAKSPSQPAEREIKGKE